jgi:hypothetical protein
MELLDGLARVCAAVFATVFACGGVLAVLAFLIFLLVLTYNTLADIGSWWHRRKFPRRVSLFTRGVLTGLQRKPAPKRED